MWRRGNSTVFGVVNRDSAICRVGRPFAASSATRRWLGVSDATPLSCPRRGRAPVAASSVRTRSTIASAPPLRLSSSALRSGAREGPRFVRRTFALQRIPCPDGVLQRFLRAMLSEPKLSPDVEQAGVAHALSQLRIIYRRQSGVSLIELPPLEMARGHDTSCGTEVRARVLGASVKRSLGAAGGLQDVTLLVQRPRASVADRCHSQR